MHRTVDFFVANANLNAELLTKVSRLLDQRKADKAEKKAAKTLEGEATEGEA